MLARTDNPVIGYFSIFMCCLATAISFVFIANLNKTHNQMLSIAITFGYATLLFNLINFKKIFHLYTLVGKNIKLLSKMNLLTLVNWLSSFMTLNYIDPATAICIILSIVTITLFFVYTPLNQIKNNKHLVCSILLILMSMSLIIKHHVSSFETVRASILGFSWCVLGGISGAFIGTHSERMGKAGFSVTQILATRFYLLILLGIIGFYFMADGSPVVIDWKYYLLASLVVVIFPLLMYQTAIRSLGALIVSLLEPFTPVFTYFLQVMVADYQFNWMTVMLLVISSLAIVWFVKIEQNIAAKRKQKLIVCIEAIPN
jgi:drug/metabolite transporter (DMT)-like permease